MKSTTYSDTYQMVTERIIAKLEAGTIPWKHFALHPLQEPRNLVSKKPYQGINRFLLSASRFGCDCWLSFKQAQELGGHVRKGERSELVVFWKFLEVEDKETAEKKQIPFLKYSHVFTVQQCDGIKVPEQTEAPTPRKTDAIAAAERIVDDMPNKPRVEFDEVPKAYYSPAEDLVHVTLRSHCTSDEAFYSTLFHELTHSTGHSSRLGREQDMGGWHRFGSSTYANEELVAEMGAAMLSAHAGIFQAVEENSAA